MEIDEWFSVQPLMHYLCLNEIGVPMGELRRSIMSSQPIGENVSFLLQHFSSGGIWRGGGPAMPDIGTGGAAQAGASG